MGKKGSNWITALKKAFTSNPKEKSTNVQLVAAQSFPQAAPQHRGDKKQRWGFGRSRPHAAEMSGIPLYRQPSSIEKILGDAEMEHQSRHYYGRAQYQIAPAKPATTVLAASHGPSATAPTTPMARERERDWERDDVYSNKHAAVLPLPPPPSSPPPLIRRFDHDRERQRQQSRADTAEWRQQQTHPRRLPVPMPMPLPRTARAEAAPAPRQRGPVPPDRARAAAVAIQAAFRGYSARRSYRSLRGLIRLQAVVRGPSVRRQTAHAMRCMQTLVRVQAQVRASRVEAMERRNGRHSSQYLRDGAAGRWRNGGSQDGGVWDDSLLSRDEADARTKRRVEAVTKRERALAYAYSHQVLKETPMAAHAILADLQSGRSPWWWAPIDRSYEPEYPRRVEPIIRPRPVPTMAHRDTTSTPMMMTQTTTAATTPARSVVSAYSKPSSRPARVARGGAAPPASIHGGGSIRDDESLTSCPAFGVPNYMTPTLSASAKARARAHVLQEQLRKEQRAAEQKPRFSFGLGQSIGSWAKSPFWKAGGGGQQQPASRVGTPAASVAGGGRHRRSVSGLSVDSTVSMPAGLGRRSFK